VTIVKFDFTVKVTHCFLVLFEVPTCIRTVAHFY